MAFGRPRVFDREKVANDLVEWAKKDDSINLNKFCALNEPRIAPSKLTLWAKEDNDFREAYEEAKCFLAYRREEWLNSQQLHVKTYDLNATVYDYFLREERRDQMEYEEKIKSQGLTSIDPQVKIQQEAIMNMLQESKSARKDAAKSTSIEQ
jgi:hypothetical protein